MQRAPEASEVGRFVPACLENNTWRYSCVGTESGTIGTLVDNEHVGQHKTHEHKQ
jgi:hypothetical protein